MISPMTPTIKSNCEWVFETKGQTLLQLFGNLHNADILPIKLIYLHQLNEYSEDAFKKLFDFFSSASLIVRSSYSAEDGKNSSLAGMFTTITDVNNPAALKKAITDVFASYGNQLDDTEHLLIQPMIHNVQHCGVLFSCDPTSNAPYFVISDDTSGQTDIVTSGQQGEVTNYYIYRHSSPTNPLLSQLISLANELMQGFSNTSIDIEYAIDNQGKLHLLQVRPLVIKNSYPNNVDENIHNIHQTLSTLMVPQPFLYGSSTVYGVMPDWNPAEIIGLHPKPLALSLYKELITNSTWAYQRDNYGYQNLRSFPLMIDFSGLPYIDVRVSFNSFLPKNISGELGHKLVDYYLKQLTDNPKCHDRVEFDIVLSCYTPSIGEKLVEMQQNGFTQSQCTELSAHLLTLTNRIIDPRTGLWIQDLHKIEKLKARHHAAKNTIKDPVQRIYWLLEDCKRHGTLPFAGLARAAFIAVQLLNSLRDTSVISEQEYDDFHASLNTVSGVMQQDLNALTKQDFLAEYGHLRPGTYDICSPRYDQAPDRYFSWASKNNQPKSNHVIKTMSIVTKNNINILLKAHGINHSADSLFHFIKCAIEGREYSKFVFTKSLSDAMEDIVELGHCYGFSRDELAFLNIGVINQLITGGDSVRRAFEDSIAQGKRLYSYGLAIKLPPLISSPTHAYEFELSDTEPNYITRNKITAYHIDCVQGNDLTDKIVFISSADPGYDWIFTHNIAGFITEFGGCNSHMAIRAAELDIPAIIGVGETNFLRWQKSELLEIDCENSSLRIIK